MRRLISIVLSVLMLAVFSALPAAAVDRLEVTITTVDDGPQPAPTGTFAVAGDGAHYLCASGTWADSGEARIWRETADGFKIRVDKIYTCDSTEQTFVLQLSGTIVYGVGNTNGSWRLVSSTGFDPAPLGSGEITMGEYGETFTGLLRLH